MRDGYAITDNEVIRQAFKQKFDAKSARLRAIAEWLLVRVPIQFCLLGKLPAQICSDVRSSSIRLCLISCNSQGHPFSMSPTTTLLV